MKARGFIKTVAEIVVSPYDSGMGVPLSEGAGWPALDTATVSRLSGVPISTLNSWVDKKLCTPSLVGPSGRRFSRYWSPRDLVVVRSIRALRGAGCSMQMLRKARRIIEKELASGEANKVAFFDGHDVLIATTDDPRMISVLQEPGQALFKHATLRLSLPVGEWLSEAVEKAGSTMIDLADIRARRIAVAKRRDAGRPVAGLKRAAGVEATSAS